MKPQNHILSLDDDEEEIEIGLAMLAKEISPHELFFLLNRQNSFCFSRAEDFLVAGKYYDYFFSCFEGFDIENKIKYKFISNKSGQATMKNVPSELFLEEGEEKLLLNLHPEADYIITSSDSVPNFSLILLPENVMFQIQTLSINSRHELFNIIQYYE